MATKKRVILVDEQPAHRLPLASMSKHYQGNPPKKSGKHRGEDMKVVNKLAKRRKLKQKRNSLLSKLLPGKKP